MKGPARFLARVATFALLAAAFGTPVAAKTASASECDRACLVDTVSHFTEELSAGRKLTVRLDNHVEIRENGKRLPLAQTIWPRLQTVRSRMVFADPLTGNVVLRAGGLTKDGQPAYVSTRLRVDGGAITDVEISADASSRVVADYVFNLSPEYERVLAPEQRMSRPALEALGRRYFQALTDHKPVIEDFAETCNRFHSGRQITNVAANVVEGGGKVTCAQSVAGDPPWSPSLEQRFPLIDPERGVILALCRLMYRDGRQMYVSEVIKVVQGKIVLIDNIGLMTPDLQTLGFQH